MIVKRPCDKIPLIFSIVVMSIVFALTACTLSPSEQPIIKELRVDMLGETFKDVIPPDPLTSAIPSQNKMPAVTPLSEKKKADWGTVYSLVNKELTYSEILNSYIVDSVDSSINGELIEFVLNTFHIDEQSSLTIYYPKSTPALFGAILSCNNINANVPQHFITIPCRKEVLEGYIKSFATEEEFLVKSYESPDEYNTIEFNMGDGKTILQMSQGGRLISTVNPANIHTFASWSPDSNFAAISFASRVRSDGRYVFLYNSQTHSYEYRLTGEEIIDAVTALGVKTQNCGIFIEPQIVWSPDSQMAKLFFHISSYNGKDADIKISLTYNVILDKIEDSSVELGT